VVAARIVGYLDQEPDQSHVGPARQVLERYARDRASEDYAQVAAVLDSQRYFDLRAALDDLADRPAWTALADEPARDVLPVLVRREWKRVRRRHRRAEDPHDLRKAVKRLRYAYELVEPAWGKSATRPQNAAHELTEVLGDRQDGLVARGWLLALASEASGDGESAFAFGRLHALEEQREAALLEEAAVAWRALKQVRW
jgi:CHAD domain-containing protein